MQIYVVRVLKKGVPLFEYEFVLASGTDFANAVALALHEFREKTGASLFDEGVELKIGLKDA